jgi:ribulose 1,5-bisphosphate synthetase/thiazole synthase
MSQNFVENGKKWRFGVFVAWVLSNTPCNDMQIRPCPDEARIINKGTGHDCQFISRDKTRNNKGF